MPPPRVRRFLRPCTRTRRPLVGPVHYSSALFCTLKKGLETKLFIHTFAHNPSKFSFKTVAFDPSFGFSCSLPFAGRVLVADMLSLLCLLWNTLNFGSLCEKYLFKRFLPRFPKLEDTSSFYDIIQMLECYESSRSQLLCDQLSLGQEHSVSPIFFLWRSRQNNVRLSTLWLAVTLKKLAANFEQKIARESSNKHCW